MTPNNIVNMSKLKGLDVIAVTDHNCVKNAPAAVSVGESVGVLVLPGIEVQTREEVHVLCYFADIDALNAFSEKLEPFRLKQENRPDYFGRQVVLDEDDAYVEEYPYLLISSIDVSIDQLKIWVDQLDGAMIPAHIDKASNSLIGQLGFIPEALSIKTIEIHDRSPIDSKWLEKYRVVHNSDAHYLTDIHEAAYFMEVKERRLESILEWLRGN